ncbi:fibronectin type III domain-containing protein [Halopiger thermotolerans]
MAWTESFDEHGDGVVPSDWSVNRDNSNGECQTDTARSYDGSTSFKIENTNTGSPSHVHAYTSAYSPSGDHRITFHAYVGSKNNSGVDSIEFKNTASAPNGAEFSWNIDLVQDGSNIHAVDGDGSGNGVQVPIASCPTDTWIEITVEVHYSRNEYYVEYNGTTYGPFHFMYNGSASHFDHFESRVDNYTAWFDAISVSNTTEHKKTLYEDWEDGDMSGWTVNGDTTNDGSRAYEGSRSVYDYDYPSGNSYRQAVRSFDAGNPFGLTFYYNEVDNSNGGCLAIYNSNGNLEVAAGTNNPQFSYNNGSESDSATSLGSEANYDEWVRCTFMFDWSAGKVSIAWLGLSSGSGGSVNVSLNHGVDIAEVAIGAWSSDHFMDMWFDYIVYHGGISAPEPPRNPALSVVADDQIDFTWDEPSDWNGERGSYTIEMDRDGTGWSDPAGGPSTPGASTTSATYTPSSDAAYERQVGIDSSFVFRIRAENSVGSSSWVSTGTAYTTPIPPHNPSVSRPDGDTIEFSWSHQSDIAVHYDIRYREDTGNGWSNWSYFAGSSEGTTESGYTATVSDDPIQRDARYQFRIQTVAHGKKSKFVYADYGNENNVFFEDDFESGDLSAWDSSNLAGDTGVISGSGPGDLTIGGGDEGSYYFYGEGVDSDQGTWIQKNLGDLSGNSNVHVRCVFATASLDDDAENFGISWYDGSSWQPVRHYHWEYNQQGWYEVHVPIDGSLLSTDNRIRIGTTTGTGMYGGDYFAVDRVVVSDIVDEYTTPAEPSGIKLDTSAEDEITAGWTNNATFWKQYDTEYRKSSSSSWTHHDDVSSTSTTITGLADGEEYDVRTRAFLEQHRHGSYQRIFASSYISATAVAKFPETTGLTVDAINPTTADLSWTDNVDNENGHRVITARHETETESWEDGLTGWTVNDLSQVTDRVHSGSYAAYSSSVVSGSPQASWTVHSGGEQVDFVSYWWNETSNSWGGGIRLKNSNGNYEIGVASDNPQWEIDDANGASGRFSPVDQYDAAGVDYYDHWVWTGILFDWANSEATVAFWSPSGSVHYVETVPLKNGTDVETVELWSYSGGIWGDSDAKHEMWWDDIWIGTDNSGLLSAGTTSYTADSLLNGEKYRTKVISETDHAMVEDR